jgi:hypothetical protein
MRSDSRATKMLLLVVTLLIAPPAKADEIDMCKAAADQAESFRGDSHLRAARERFLECSRDACPRVTREACSLGFSDVEQLIPTVVFHARDTRGRDVLGVRVLVDQVVMASRLTGTATRLDPGPHRFRYEAANGDAYEETLLIAVGEHNRMIAINFPTALETDGTAPPIGLPPPAPAPTPDAEPTPTTIWPTVGAAAAGVVGIGLFSVLDLQSWADYHALKEDRCAASRTCDVSGIKTKIVVADVALGVGIVALGVAALLALGSHKARSAAQR